MKSLLLIIIFSLPILLFAQSKQDSTGHTSTVYKKRVLENAEIDLLTSFYTQDGDKAAVTGGVGTEQLNDFASTIHIAIPLNADDVITADATISAYTSASSSNLNPFDKKEGTPWAASSGASKEDIWGNGTLGYSHSSDDRNSIYTANLSFSAEYDYTSGGIGGGFTKLFNQKNTVLDINANVFIDFWSPEYPIELKTYREQNGNLNTGVFAGQNIWDSNQNAIDKNGSNAWKPLQTKGIDTKNRNTYSLSLQFSQILSRNAQFSIFSDFVYQQGWLANPMQRVYFADVDNFYMGNSASIPNYTNSSNTDVFQLADDIERLPSSRLKIPVGVRFNYFINEFLIVKTYYRYYFDDWGIQSHTANIELPIKVGLKFTLYPTFRFYNQTAADYFAPFEQHLSTENYYSSDNDLSKYSANEYGLGIKYTDIFTEKHIWKFGLKNVSLDYKFYKRNTGFSAHIVSLGVKFVLKEKIRFTRPTMF